MPHFTRVQELPIDSYVTLQHYATKRCCHTCISCNIVLTIGPLFVGFENKNVKVISVTHIVFFQKKGLKNVCGNQYFATCGFD